MITTNYSWGIELLEGRGNFGEALETGKEISADKTTGEFYLERISF
jgi:hypothetical protein